MNRIQRRYRQVVSTVVAASMLGIAAPAASADSSLPTARLERTLYLIANPNGGAQADSHRDIILDGGYYHWHFGLAVTDGSSPFYVERSEGGRDIYLEQGTYAWWCTIYQGGYIYDALHRPLGSYYAECSLAGWPAARFETNWFYLPHSGEYKMASYLDPF
ncbi:hypothetical protein [Actinomadura montaniterrae]|uniref:hypothetical protein n=1 Tax=Actinomadura montaniterrae TaxID=1803903 RepID=UPI00178C62C9|nr:hypothetical protein [Actinomadura montaniterrae]